MSRTEREHRGAAYGFAAGLMRAVAVSTTKPEWRGVEHLPKRGGVVVCVNHISYADPLVFGQFLHDNGRTVRYLAKDGLFRLPVAGRIIRAAGQIPVYRGSREAASAFRDAVAAVQRGLCVAIYPEGTITRDPGMWPMAGRTGAARVALATSAPVIPVAQWGPQHVLAPYAKRPHLWPRTRVQVWAGPPVDLDDLRALAPEQVTSDVLREATERILRDITGLLEQIRGEKAPAVRFDPRQMGVPETGDPRRRARP